MDSHLNHSLISFSSYLVLCLRYSMSSGVSRGSRLFLFLMNLRLFPDKSRNTLNFYKVLLIFISRLLTGFFMTPLSQAT